MPYGMILAVELLFIATYFLFQSFRNTKFCCNHLGILLYILPFPFSHSSPFMTPVLPFF